MTNLKLVVTAAALALTSPLGLAANVAPTSASGMSPVTTQTVSHPGADPWAVVPREHRAAECGLDPDLLEKADAKYLYPFTIMRYGKLCYVSDQAATTQTYHVWSLTKSMGATLFGMIAKRSTLLEDTDKATEWLRRRELGAINPDATLAHVLAMTGSCRNLERDQKCRWTYDAVGAREIDKLIPVMNRAIAAEPERFPGVRNVREFAQKELFDKLGMRDTNWSGLSIAGTMNSSTQDQSRLALLWLRKGVWGEEQLLEERYVYRMTHPAFEDANTGYGYLTLVNGDTGSYSSGVPDRECSPYAVWPRYPHAPFEEATHDYGGSPFAEDQRFDIGLAWAAGFLGQRVSVHRGLDMVISVRSDLSNNGHWRVWDAIRPALVAHDPKYKGDEAGFCAAYQRGAYAPDLHSPWSTNASR